MLVSEVCRGDPSTLLGRVTEGVTSVTSADVGWWLFGKRGNKRSQWCYGHLTVHNYNDLLTKKSADYCKETYHDHSRPVFVVENH